MMLLHLTCLALSATTALTSTPAGWLADHTPVADSTPVLTVDTLTHMTNFWTAFVKEPDAITVAGVQSNQKAQQIPVGSKTEEVIMEDMSAIAQKFPVVAADLKKAGLTAQQLEAYRVAVISAYLTQRFEEFEGDPAGPATSALNKNIAFLNSDPKEFDALTATGVWFPVAPLTVDALTRMTNFWTTFVKERASIKTEGRANGKMLFVPCGQRSIIARSVEDMSRMAAKYPFVAAALKKAGLTAQQWGAYYVALYSAALAPKVQQELQLHTIQDRQVGDRVDTAPATSALGKNIAFVSSHKKELDALKATGMQFLP